MIVDRDITRFIVFSDDTFSQALTKISANKLGVVFVLAKNGVLEGILTDGDFRRWLLGTQKLDLSLPVALAANRTFVSCEDVVSPEEISLRFSERIRFIPLVDRQQRLVAVALRNSQELRIGSINVSDSSPCFVIAEIGNNHQGDLAFAMRLIDEAVTANADCAKFQMRNMVAMYGSRAGNTAGADLGAQYTLDLLARFQLTNEDLFKAFDYCKERGILPLCTPWDKESLTALENYGMLAYKVASADLTNHDLLEAISKTGKPMICSTGMSSESEIGEAVRLLKHKGAPYALLHCNSTYPAPFKDVHLNYLPRLKELAAGSPVGYSGHERGYSVAIAAVALGARIVEKHFSLDRGLEGNDHRVSLMPLEFSDMVSAIRNVEQALGSNETRRITQGEMMNREVLAKSVIARRPIVKGQVIEEADMDVRSPGRGLAPNRRKDLIGRPSPRDLNAGEFFYPSDLTDSASECREYRFQRPFGIPVRYHDVAQIGRQSNFDLLEFHLSYNDMDLDAADYLVATGYDMDLVVHSPELFPGDHLMDLCSSDLAYRARSMRELQRVIDIARSLKPFFKRATRVPIVVNVGGYTFDAFMPLAERGHKYDMIAAAIEELDTDGVEIIPQTLPPYPWFFGGQRFSNLFVDADEIVQFCHKHQMRVCLDISHSKLACTHSHQSFMAFLDKVAPFAAHIHMVDARGVDGEGLQIGEGEIDFGLVANMINKHCPNASFIPEIWQGHKNGGEGFWIALERLEEILCRPT